MKPSNKRRDICRQAAGVLAVVVATGGLALLAIVGIGDELTATRMSNFQTTW